MITHALKLGSKVNVIKALILYKICPLQFITIANVHKTGADWLQKGDTCTKSCPMAATGQEVINNAEKMRMGITTDEENRKKIQRE